MRRAIWFPAGVFVVVRNYDEHTNIAIIEHDDGRWEAVETSKIHLLEYPGYLSVGEDAEG